MATNVRHPRFRIVMLLSLALCGEVLLSSCDKKEKEAKKGGGVVVDTKVTLTDGMTKPGASTFGFVAVTNRPEVDVALTEEDSGGVRYAKNLIQQQFGAFVECTTVGDKVRADVVMDELILQGALGNLYITDNRTLVLVDLKSGKAEKNVPCRVLGDHLLTVPMIESAMNKVLAEGSSPSDGDYALAQSLFLNLRGAYDRKNPKVISTLFFQSFFDMRRNYQGATSNTIATAAQEILELDGAFLPCAEEAAPAAFKDLRNKAFTCLPVGTGGDLIDYAPVAGSYSKVRNEIAELISKIGDETIPIQGEGDDVLLSVLTTTTAWNAVGAEGADLAKFLAGKNAGFDFGGFFAADTYAALGGGAGGLGLHAGDSPPKTKTGGTPPPKFNGPQPPPAKKGPTKPPQGKPTQGKTPGKTPGKTTPGKTPGKTTPGKTPAAPGPADKNTSTTSEAAKADFVKSLKSNTAINNRPLADGRSSTENASAKNSDTSFKKDSFLGKSQALQQQSDAKLADELGKAVEGKSDKFSDMGNVKGEVENPNIRRFDTKDGESTVFVQKDPKNPAAPAKVETWTKNKEGGFDLNPGTGAGKAGGMDIVLPGKDLGSKADDKPAHIGISQKVDANGVRNLELDTARAGEGTKKTNFTMKDNKDGTTSFDMEGAAGKKNLEAAKDAGFQTQKSLNELNSQKGALDSKLADSTLKAEERKELESQKNNLDLAMNKEKENLDYVRNISNADMKKQIDDGIAQAAKEDTKETKAAGDPKPAVPPADPSKPAKADALKNEPAKPGPTDGDKKANPADSSAADKAQADKDKTPSSGDKAVDEKKSAADKAADELKKAEADAADAVNKGGDTSATEAKVREAQEKKDAADAALKAEKEKTPSDKVVDEKKSAAEKADADLKKAEADAADAVNKGGDTSATEAKVREAQEKKDAADAAVKDAEKMAAVDSSKTDAARSEKESAVSKADADLKKAEADAADAVNKGGDTSATEAKVREAQEKKDAAEAALKAVDAPKDAKDDAGVVKKDTQEFAKDKPAEAGAKKDQSPADALDADVASKKSAADKAASDLEKANADAADAVNKGGDTSATEAKQREAQEKKDAADTALKNAEQTASADSSRADAAQGAKQTAAEKADAELKKAEAENSEAINNNGDTSATEAKVREAQEKKDAADAALKPDEKLPDSSKADADQAAAAAADSSKADAAKATESNDSSASDFTPTEPKETPPAPTPTDQKLATDGQKAVAADATDATKMLPGLDSTGTPLGEGGTPSDVFPDSSVADTNDTPFPDSSAADNSVFPDSSAADNSTFPDSSAADNSTFPDSSAADNSVFPDSSAADNSTFPDSSATDNTAVPDNSFPDSSAQESFPDSSAQESFPDSSAQESFPDSSAPEAPPPPPPPPPPEPEAAPDPSE